MSTTHDTRETLATRRALRAATLEGQRAQARRELEAFRESVRTLKRERAALLVRVRAQCATARDRARAAAKARRAAALRALRTELKQFRQAERNRCQGRKVSVRLDFGKRIGAKMAAAEQARRDQASVRRVDSHRKKAEAKAEAHVQRRESDDEVRANLDADLVPVFDMMRSKVHARPGMSRTEAFTHWIAENESEVWPIREHIAQVQLGELMRAQRKADQAHARELAAQRQAERAERKAAKPRERAAAKKAKATARAEVRAAELAEKAAGKAAQAAQVAAGRAARKAAAIERKARGRVRHGLPAALPAPPPAPKPRKTRATKAPLTGAARVAAADARREKKAAKTAALIATVAPFPYAPSVPEALDYRGRRSGARAAALARKERQPKEPSFAELRELAAQELAAQELARQVGIDWSAPGVDRGSLAYEQARERASVTERAEMDRAAYFERQAAEEAAELARQAELGRIYRETAEHAAKQDRAQAEQEAPWIASRQAILRGAPAVTAEAKKYAAAVKRAAGLIRARAIGGTSREAMQSAVAKAESLARWVEPDEREAAWALRPQAAAADEAARVLRMANLEAEAARLRAAKREEWTGLGGYERELRLTEDARRRAARVGAFEADEASKAAERAQADERRRAAGLPELSPVERLRAELGPADPNEEAGIARAEGYDPRTPAMRAKVATIAANLRAELQAIKAAQAAEALARDVPF